MTSLLPPQGKIPEIELKPSAPLAESLVSGQMNLLKEIRGDLEIKLQMTSDLVRSDVHLNTYFGENPVIFHLPIKRSETCTSNFNIYLLGFS